MKQLVSKRENMCCRSHAGYCDPGWSHNATCLRNDEFAIAQTNSQLRSSQGALWKHQISRYPD